MKEIHPVVRESGRATPRDFHPHCLLLLLAASGFCHRSIAQAPGALDTSFNPPPGLGFDTSKPVALTPENQLLLGGFSLAGGFNALICLNEDGSQGSFPSLRAPSDFLEPLPDGGLILGDFGRIQRSDALGVLQPLPSLSGANGVLALDDGRFYVAGIRTLGGVTSGLVRFLPDGSDDRTFAASATLEDYGFSGRNHILPQSDGRVVVVGPFQRAAGIPRLGFARFNPDGSLDAGYDPALALNLTDSGLEGGCTVRFAKLTADGAVIAHVLRAPRNLSGPGYSRIVRITPEGLPDPGFQPPTDLADHVWSGAVQPDGAVIIAGGFTQIAGEARAGIARLRPDGRLDPDFRPVVTGDVPWIRLVLPDGRVLIGGGFTAINGHSVGRLARLFAYSPAAQPPTAKAVRRRVKAAPGEAVRLDTLVSGWPRPQLQWQRAGFVVPDQTNRSLTLPVARVVDAGTYFLTASNSGGMVQVEVELEVAERSLLAGQVDHSDSIELPTWAWPKAIVPLADGRILLGGAGFQLAGESPADPYRIVFRINADGSPDLAFNLAQTPHSNQVVEAIEPSPEGYYVGGSFNGYQGLAVNHLMRLTADGLVDPAFAPQLGGAGMSVNCLRLLSEGRLLVGGRFDTVNGIPARCMAILRRDGSLDPSLTSPLEAASQVTGMLPLTDGGMLVAGSAFAGPNSLSPWQKMVRLQSDGMINDTYQAANTSAQTMIAGDGDRIIFASVSRLGSVLPGGQADVSFGTRSELLTGSMDRARLLGDGTGDIYVGLGRGAQIEGVRGLKGVARLHADGRLDRSFAPAGLQDGVCLGLALMPDGRIVLAHTTSMGSIQTRLLFLHPDPDRTLLRPSVSDGRLRATLPTLEGRRYALESSPTGVAGNWQRVRELDGDGFQQLLTVPAGDATTHMIRVRRIH